MMLALILTCETGSNWRSGKVPVEALILVTPVQNQGLGVSSYSCNFVKCLPKIEIKKLIE